MSAWAPRIAGALAALALSVAQNATAAEAAGAGCMVSPTDRGVVSGRFGKVRPGGAGNFGSANRRPHMHDGLDFSTSGIAQPVRATSAGVITYIGQRGTAGSAILLRRPNGDVVAYYHMGGFAPGLRVGTEVQAGQVLGVSGNTPSASMVKHLHLTYGTARRDEARGRAFQANAAKGPFNPGQLPSVINQQRDIGWKTDPSPYFCEAFPIQDGNPQDVGILGSTTMEQYSIMFEGGAAGGPTPNAQFDTSQVITANMDAARAGAEGSTPSEWLSDGDSYGMPPQPPIGDYETMSTSEMLMTEAWRRFNDAKWNADVTKLSMRALWVDYNRAIGVGNYLSHAIHRKKERIEALMALLVARKLDPLRAETDASHQKASAQHVNRQINGRR